MGKSHLIGRLMPPASKSPRIRGSVPHLARATSVRVEADFWVPVYMGGRVKHARERAGHEPARLRACFCSQGLRVNRWAPENCRNGSQLQTRRNAMSPRPKTGAHCCFQTRKHRAQHMPGNMLRLGNRPRLKEKIANPSPLIPGVSAVRGLREPLRAPDGDQGRPGTNTCPPVAPVPP